MKKTVLVILALMLLLALSACKGEEDDGKALETADTFYDVSGGVGVISINEDVARTLLEVYPESVLGLNGALDEYELKLSATRLFDQDACMVEAVSEGSESAEKTFVILGSSCYVYDEAQKKYLLMTATGAVDESQPASTVPQTSEKNNEASEGFVYNEENNERLQRRFSAYSAEALGLEKELGEYVLIAAGTTTTASDGKTVFVIRLYEKTGAATNLTLAFNESGSYSFNGESGRYEKLG